MAVEHPEALRSLGSRFRYGIFAALVRCRLIAPARLALAAVVLYYTLVPQVRRRCAAYLARRFPGLGPLRRLVCAYRLYLAYGNVLLDRMIAGITGRFSLCATAPEVRRLLADAGKNSRGRIVLPAHIGAWQVGLAGLEQFDTPVNIVQRKTPGDPDKHYFERGKGKPFRVIDAADPVGSLVEAAAALRRGEIVCLMGDRLPARSPASHGVEIPFLGGVVRLPVNAYALASLTGADLLMLFTVREKGLTKVLSAERIEVPPGLSRRDPAVFRPYALRFARGMEEVVARYPYQFFNFYDMWL